MPSCRAFSNALSVAPDHSLDPHRSRHIFAYFQLPNHRRSKLKWRGKFCSRGSARTSGDAKTGFNSDSARRFAASRELFCGRLFQLCHVQSRERRAISPTLDRIELYGSFHRLSWEASERAVESAGLTPIFSLHMITNEGGQSSLLPYLHSSAHPY